MERELTLGERYVGLTFNPSSDPTVQKVKELYAEIIDIVNQLPDTDGKERERFTELAIGQAVIAQMAAVKAVTWKD